MLRKFVVQAVSMAAFSAAALTATSTMASAQENRINFQGTLNVTPIPLVPNAPDLSIDFLSGALGFAGQTIAGGTTGTLDVSAGLGIFSVVPIGLNNATIADLRINSTGLGAPFTTLQLNQPPSTSPFLVAGGFQFFATEFVNQTSTATGIAFGPILLTSLGTSTVGSVAVRGFVQGNGLTGTGNRFDGGLTTIFASSTPLQVFNTVNDGGTFTRRAVGVEFDVKMNVVPEPSTYALMGIGLAALGMVARRRRLYA